MSETFEMLRHFAPPRDREGLFSDILIQLTAMNYTWIRISLSKISHHLLTSEFTFLISCSSKFTSMSWRSVLGSYRRKMRIGSVQCRRAGRRPGVKATGSYKQDFADALTSDQYYDDVEEVEGSYKLALSRVSARHPGWDFTGYHPMIDG